MVKSSDIDKVQSLISLEGVKILRYITLFELPHTHSKTLLAIYGKKILALKSSPMTQRQNLIKVQGLTSSYRVEIRVCMYTESYSEHQE